MINIEVTSDISEIEGRLGNLSRKANMVMKQAANNAMKTALADTKKETSKRYHVLQKDVMATIHTEEATVDRPYAKIISRAEHSNLIKFHVIQSRSWKKLKPSGKRVPKYYLANVLKSVSGKPLTGNPKPFVATMGNGFQGVFVRKSNSGRKIKDVFGPTMTQMISNKEIVGIIKKNAYEELSDGIEDKLQKILKK